MVRVIGVLELAKLFGRKVQALQYDSFSNRQLVMPFCSPLVDMEVMCLKR